MERLRDMNGRAIEPGDVLKVFHFVGQNRKRHYLYKQAMRYERDRLLISHMNRIDDNERWEIGKNYYSVGGHEKVLNGYEIIQSVDAKFDERQKILA